MNNQQKNGGPLELGNTVVHSCVDPEGGTLSHLMNYISTRENYVLTLYYLGEGYSHFRGCAADTENIEVLKI